jgi:uncharacterized protein (TIGR02145 family)/uncharacterized repeat protein (TIGR02543 family)
MQPKIIIKSLVFAFLFLSCQDNVLYKSPVFLPHCVGGVAKGWLPDSLCADPTRFLSADTFRVGDSMTFAGIVVNAGTAAKTYQWDLGDGRIVEGAVARTIYSQGGIYHPIFRVGDSVGGYLLDSVYVVVKTPPDSVVLLYPPPKSVDIDPKKLLLKWQGFDRDTFGGPLRYTVIVKRAGGMIDTVIHKATITQFDLSGVIRPGETVSWKAIAYDGFGDSITCAYASFTALIAPYLTALGRLTVNGASWPCVDSLLAVKIDTVPYSIDSLRIEVAAQDSQARLSSGSDTSLTLLSVNRALLVGENAIPITVIAYENVASRTYLLRIHKTANNNATLRDLAFSVGNLMTPFKPQKDTIRDTVPYLNDSIIITATATDSFALVSAIGATSSSGFALTFAAPLKVGPNSIKLTVVAADSVTKKDYVLSIFRRYNSNVALCSLMVLAGTVAQKLGTGNDTLRDTVAWAITSLTIAAKAYDPQAQVRIGTGSSSLGTASQKIDLNIGVNILPIRIIAADSLSTRDYVLSVKRLQPNNPTLASLSLSSGTLVPSFAQNVATFRDTVIYTVDSIDIIATTDSLSSVTMGAGNPFKGSNKQRIGLMVGTTQMSVKVTAPDNILTTVYTLLITRLPNPNAALSALSVSTGSLFPVFTPNNDTLRDTIPYSAGTLTISAVALDSQATITIAGASAKGRLSAPNTLTQGTNIIPIKIIAADGMGSRVYYVLVYCYLPLTTPPVNLHAVAQSISSIILAWDHLPWASRYAIQRSETPGGAMRQIWAGSDTFFIDTGLSEGATYYYRISASNPGGATGLSAEVSATTYSRVSISGQPKVQKVFEGSQAVFSIAATGIPAPWYQWQKNGVAIPKAIASACTLSNVVLADNGAIIRCQVGNIVDTIFSAPATLTIDSLFIAPAITSASHDTTIVFGSSFVVRVATSGTYLNYQWRKNGASISGAIGTAYAVQSAALTDAGIYSMEVWNKKDSAISASARVRVKPVMPTGLAAQAQSNTKMNVSWTQAGGALWYKLLRSIDSTHFALACSTAQVSCIDSNLTEGQLYEYRIAAGNSDGISDTSAIVSMVTMIGPSIIKQPKPQSLRVGGTISLGINAMGSMPLTYQWYKNNSAILGENNPSFELVNASANDSGSYMVTAINPIRRVNSTTVHVSVLPFYTVTTNSNPSVGGTIVRSKDTANYLQGDSLRLTARAATGYRFIGWTGDTICIDTLINITATKNGAITANFIRRCTVSFNSQGGNAVTAQTVDSGSYAATPTAPTMAGYTLGGWFKEAGCINQWIFASDTVNADRTLYAKWNIIYTINFDGQGATTPANPAVKTVASPATTLDALPIPPIKTGCIFSGWYTSRFGQGTEFKASTVVTENFTIYANWTVTDIDGNVYHIATIGNQNWMVENLKTTKFNDGNAIPLFTDNTAWGNLGSPGFCWYENNEASNKIPYGALYNWYAVGTGKLAPSGWRVASDSDWTALGTFVGSAGKLKEAGTTHWNSPNTDATNETGFTALPGGYRYNYGTYSFLGQYGHWWTSAEKDSGNTWNRDMHFNDATLFRNNYNKRYGFSVRCIQGGNQYNVTFNSQGGSAVSSQLVNSGSHTTEPVASTRTGYTFVGWFKEAACTNAWNFASETVTGPITLYAKWIVMDIDGNIYTTVSIGTQTWTVENLRTTKYNDGSPIPLVTNDGPWSGLGTGAYCFYGNTTEATQQQRLGALYNWYTVNTGKLTPAGWHVPSDSEWSVLENYLIANGYNFDGTTMGNKIAKSMAANTDWTLSTNTGAVGNDLSANNRSGFSALPVGHRYYTGGFLAQSEDIFLWSTTENNASSAYFRCLYFGVSYSQRSTYDKTFGCSVRLIRDY